MKPSMLEVSYNVEEGLWIVTDWYSYDEFLIPKGYKTDLASIPRCIWPIIAPFELSIVAPVIHDYLYGRSGSVNGRLLTRKEVDDLFLKIMEEEHVPRWRRILAYRAVRLFAGRHWIP